MVSSTNKCSGWQWGPPYHRSFANMFMEMFAIKALATALNPPGLWGWNIDDTGTIQQKKHHVQGMFKHINVQHESIAFIVEEQDSEGNLPMLEMTWMLECDKISTDVYRKPTHTDYYLQ